MEQKQYKLITCISMLLLSITTIASDFEESRTKRFTQKIIAQASVELTNQYGEIQIIEWEGDSVKVEATISVSSDKEDDIEKLMNMVEVEFRGNESNVVVSTEWTSGSNFIIRGAMDLKNLFKSDKKLTVDYKVYMPVKCRLSISNRFGDVYLPDYKGALRVNLTHGDLRAREIADARNITVKYGKVLMKRVESGLLKLEFGSMIIDKAGSLTLESRSSTVEVLEVNRLAIESRNDELRIDKVESLRGQSTYSHIRVRNISKLVDLNTAYGDLILKGIKEDFKLVRLQGNGTDYDLEFVPEAKYRFDVEIVGTRTFSYPMEAKITNEEGENNEKKFEGYLGDEKVTPLVNIYLKNGYVVLYKP